MSMYPNTDDELGLPVTVISEMGFERNVEYPNGVQAPEYWVEGESDGDDGEWLFVYDEFGNRIYEEEA